MGRPREARPEAKGNKITQGHQSQRKDSDFLGWRCHHWILGRLSESHMRSEKRTELRMLHSHQSRVSRCPFIVPLRCQVGRYRFMMEKGRCGIFHPKLPQVCHRLGKFHSSNCSDKLLILSHPQVVQIHPQIILYHRHKAQVLPAPAAVTSFIQTAVGSSLESSRNPKEPRYLPLLHGLFPPHSNSRAPVQPKPNHLLLMPPCHEVETEALPVVLSMSNSSAYNWTRRPNNA